MIVFVGVGVRYQSNRPHDVGWAEFRFFTRWANTYEADLRLSRRTRRLFIRETP